jgi:membrane protease YdiL (CAAX protease family)
MRKVFWNRSELRLRAGWRILIQIAMISFPLTIFAYLGIYSSGELTDTKVMATALPVTVISILFLGRYIDKRQFVDYGFHLRQVKWWQEYGMGLLVGFLSAGLFVSLLVIIGVAEIELFSQFVSNGKLFLSSLIISIVTYAGIGVFEELVRVYQVRNITEGLAKSRTGVVGAMFLAICGASLYSGIMHLASQDFFFLIFILTSAAIYGTYYLFTKRTAIAMANHFAWDLTISFIFLLGATSTQETALFIVPIKTMSRIDSGIFLPVLGIIVRIVGLGCIALWIKWREGAIRFQRELAVPTLIVERKPDAT